MSKYRNIFGVIKKAHNLAAPVAWLWVVSRGCAAVTLSDPQGIADGRRQDSQTHHLAPAADHQPLVPQQEPVAVERLAIDPSRTIVRVVDVPGSLSQALELCQPAFVQRVICSTNREEHPVTIMGCPDALRVLICKLCLNM